MYNVIKNVIISKRYELKDMLVKIDTLWIQGGITGEQRAELVDLTRTNAMISNSLDVLAKLADLDMRVKILEAIIAELNKKPEDGEPSDGETEGDDADGENTEVNEPTYPKYEAGVWYRNGDIVSFEGENYKCIAPDGQVCVWSPKEYPIYWEKIEDNSESEA